MSLSSAKPNGSNHGNKYLTLVLLLALAVGLFVATLTYLAF